MTETQNSHSTRSVGKNFGLWVARIALMLFLLLPVYNGLVISLTSLGSLGEGYLFPWQFEWQTYVEVFEVTNLGRQIINSLIFAVSVTVLNLMITVPAAYSLSRYQFTGRNVFMFVLLLTQMFAAIIVLPALYTLIRYMGLLDTYTGVIIVIVAVTTALSVWLLKGFFDSISVEIEEAAMIDGCSRLQVLRQIILPLSKPGILTAGIFTYITAYNQFLIPLVFISDESKLPITVGIYNLFGEMAPPYPHIMAATLVGVLPVLLVYIFAQEYIITGLTSGGLKG